MAVAGHRCHALQRFAAASSLRLSVFRSYGSAPQRIVGRIGVLFSHVCKEERDGRSGEPCSAAPHGTDELLSMLAERRASGRDAGPGRVYLVGTGPGDPGLLTLRAAQLLQSADVVLYDRLVSDDILRMVGQDALMVYVGKERGFHTRTQDQIHNLLLEFSSAGARVVRLKGGDPFVFGRGGEEVEYLQQFGIQVQCVPGITAASGISAELGVPLTQRGVATSVRFLTGHAREGGEELLDQTIGTCGDPHTTLVVYMGLHTLPTLVQRLHAEGLPGDTPAVAVEHGTTPDQRVLHSTLRDLADGSEVAELKSPTLIIIGRVVALSPGWQLWCEMGRPHGFVFDAAMLPETVQAAHGTPQPQSADRSEASPLA